MGISITKRQKKPSVSSQTLKKNVQTIFEGLGLTDVELSILLTEDDEIRELNKTWRGKDGATDVLSFSQEEGQPDAPIPSHGGPRLLGDVVISLPTASKQAQAAGVDLEEEIQRLVIHGILHLLGHDHEQGGRRAALMKKEERRLFALVAARAS